jgi:hypothetical protein
VRKKWMNLLFDSGVVELDPEGRTEMRDALKILS